MVRLQYVGHPVVARIDPDALHSPDRTVEGMDGLTAVDVFFTQRNNVLDNDLHRSCDTQRRASPKLRDPADANANSDLGKRWVRYVGVLATCRCPARHPAVR